MDASFGGLFLGGLLTFVSPCVLPLIPIYLVMLLGSIPEKAGTKDRLKAFFTTLFFVAGFTVVFVIMGLSATYIGQTLVTHRDLFERLGGLLVILLGLKFMGYLRVPFLDMDIRPEAARFSTRFKYLNAFILGFAFAFGWSPCVGPILGAVLTYTSMTTSSPMHGALLLLVYSLGFAVPLLLLSIFVDQAAKLVAGIKRYGGVIERVTGGLAILVGLLLLTGNLGMIDEIYMPTQSAIAANQGNPQGSEKAFGLSALGKEEESCNSKGVQSCKSKHCLCKISPGPQVFNAPSAIHGSGVPRLIEFYSKYCPICRAMMPVIGALRNRCHGQNLLIQQIDITKKQNKRYISQFGIIGVPVFVFLNSQGKEIGRLLGKQNPTAFDPYITALLGKKCRDYSPLQRPD